MTIDILVCEIHYIMKMWLRSSQAKELRLRMENRLQAPSLDRQNVMAFEILWILRTGRIKARRHNIDDVTDLRRQLAYESRGLNHARPMNNERRRDAALMNPMFIEPEWRVARVRPR